MKPKPITTIILFAVVAGIILFVSLMPNTQLRQTLGFNHSNIFDTTVAYFQARPRLIGLPLSCLGLFFFVTTLLNWQWMYGDNNNFFSGSYKGRFYGKQSPKQKRRWGFAIGILALAIGLLKFWGLW